MLDLYEKYSECYKLCDEGRAALLNAAQKICSDEKLCAQAMDIKNRLVNSPYNFEENGEFRVMDASFGAFVCTIAIEEMEKFYLSKGIPLEIFLATIGDLGIWINHHYNCFGEWGLSSFGWFRLHFQGKIFQLGRLQFEIARIDEILRPDTDAGLNLSFGDDFLDVHIPRGRRLDEQACFDSFEQAKVFFSQYLNEYEFKAFVCYTWLFDPCFKDLLPCDSNILKFQRMFNIYKYDKESYSGLKYIFNNVTKDNIADAPKDTALRKATAEHILNGGIMRKGAGYRMI